MNDTTEKTWDKAMRQFSDAVEQMNVVVLPELEISSFADELDTISMQINSPVVLAKLLMANMESPDSMTTAEKLFWARIADEIGLDWTGKFWRIGRFMEAVVEP